MHIGNKIFPYPILNSDRDKSGYINSTFMFDFNKNDGELINKNGEIILEDLCFKLDNAELNKLFDDGIIDIFCIVECSNTVYRKIIKLQRKPITVKIPVKDLSNRVTISAYGIARKDINGFSNVDFIDDYKDYNFDIERNQVLIADDGIRFHIDIDDIDDNKMSSIFSIIKQDDAGEIVSYFDEDNKISIHLSHEHYKQYEQMKNNSQFNNVFFAMLVIPALSCCIRDIQQKISMDETIEDIVENKSWFRSIQRRYKILNGTELSVDDLKGSDSFVFAQQMMNFSTCAGINDYYNMAFNVGEEDTDE